MKRLHFVLHCLLLFLCLKAQSQFLTGFDAMKTISQLPLNFPVGSETRQFSAYDPDGKNWDHNFPAAFTREIDSSQTPDGRWVKEYVIYDDFGPGCLFRQHFNPWFDRSAIPDGWIPVGEFGQPRANANIRYYFDNEKEPGIDMFLGDYFSGKFPPFSPPLCFADSLRLFSILYYPLTYKERLRITLRPNDPSFEQMDTKWYQYTGISYPADFPITSWKGPQTDDQQVRKQWEHYGENPNDLSNAKIIKTDTPLKDNESATVLKISKPGSLAGLKIRVEPYTKETFYKTRIRIYWDSNKEPAVDLPLSSFFGGGGMEYPTSDQIFDKSLTSLLFGFSRETGTFYSYFPMPFWKSAEIVVENLSVTDLSRLSCEAGFIPMDKLNYPEGNAGYFCAKRILDSDPDTTAFRNVIFSDSGSGHVAAVMFYTDRYDMDGDEFTYIDDSRTPQIHGNGTEDDHNQGWAGRGYQKPLWGGVINGYNGSYRIYLNDSYIYHRNILISFEHSLTKPRFINGGRTEAVTFYYKNKGESDLELCDEIDVGNHFSEDAHSYQVNGLTWKGSFTADYDGYERNLNFGTCTDDGKAFKGSSSFTINLNPQNNGIKLRKRVNRADNGVQEAEVYVDGVKVSRPWLIFTASISTGKGNFDGWYDSDFNIPGSYTKGKRAVNIEIRYKRAMHNELNEFYYWIYSFL